MSPWFAKAIILVATIAMVVIPHGVHGRRSGEIKVVKSLKGPREVALLALVSLGFLLPIIWVVTPLLDFANYPLRPVPFIAGILCYAVGLWLLHRSHADLGANWSITLEVRERHELVTRGIYRSVRHPMYLALLLYSAGQALVVPNWVAGPSYGVAFVTLILFRIAREERMMLEEFGRDYEEYRARSKRLVPGVW
ncbi:MAG TPA: protein-S-isoprenylcysteine O-methyltransferase [Candidatus Polarisedimenticolia bacterium]|jgi:protein-S-isoprenylcysteine O-methyltransferase Ste14